MPLLNYVTFMWWSSACIFCWYAFHTYIHLCIIRLSEIRLKDVKDDQIKLGIFIKYKLNIFENFVTVCYHVPFENAFYHNLLAGVQDAG